MKFTTSQQDLNANLSLVSRAVPSRPSHPVLANILAIASIEDQTITLTAFDLSLGLRTTFNAMVEEGGKITFPAKLLADIVSRLPAGDVAIAIDGTIATITTGYGKYEIRGMSADDFPELPTVEEGEAIALSTEALTEGLRSTLFATSSDESKQVLTGVHITADGESIEFGGTDGHRLAVAVSEIPAIERSLEVTVPSKALRELERMAANSEAIALQYDQGQLIAQTANQTLTTRLLEGQYPNYRQLIPKKFERRLTCDRKQLISALERISVLADQKNGIVKLGLSEAELVLSVEAQDVGSAREVLECQFSGDELEIAFNVKYLLEGLKAISTSEVSFEFNTATSPAVVSPLGGQKMTYLCMPVQIRN